jgi:hypothetical protein
MREKKMKNVHIITGRKKNNNAASYIEMYCSYCIDGHVHSCYMKLCVDVISNLCFFFVCLFLLSSEFFICLIVPPAHPRHIFYQLNSWFHYWRLIKSSILHNKENVMFINRLMNDSFCCVIFWSVN